MTPTNEDTDLWDTYTLRLPLTRAQSVNMDEGQRLLILSSSL